MEPTNLDQDPDIDADYFLFFYDSQQGVGNRKIDPLPTLPDPNSSDRQYLLPALDTTSQFLSERLTTHTTHEISTIIYLQLLILFKFAKKLKKSNVRTSLIRSHKNATRRSLENKIPKNANTEKNSISNRTRAEITACENFCKFNLANADVMNDASMTDNSPDSIAKKKCLLNQGARDIVLYKSYNDEFCSKYFSIQPVAESFALYIEFLFAEINCELLCKHFKFRCCDANLHLAACKELWLRLKNDLKTEFIDAHRNSL